MKEPEFISWATEQVKSLDPKELQIAEILEPLKISPVDGDADLIMEMMEIPGLSLQRIAKFRAVRYVSDNEVVWKWEFDCIAFPGRYFLDLDS